MCVYVYIHTHVKVAQLCPTVCDPMDYTVHEILQARILEWVAFPFSRGSSQPRDQTRFPALQADSLPAEPQGKLIVVLEKQKSKKYLNVKIRFTKYL